jgi:hypothetical protein
MLYVIYMYMCMMCVCSIWLLHVGFDFKLFYYIRVYFTLILKFYEKFETFWKFLKILSFWSFLKSYEIFESFEILWKFWIKKSKYKRSKRAICCMSYTCTCVWCVCVAYDFSMLVLISFCLTCDIVAEIQTNRSHFNNLSPKFFTCKNVGDRVQVTGYYTITALERDQYEVLWSRVQQYWTSVVIVFRNCFLLINMLEKFIKFQNIQKILIFFFNSKFS